MPEGQNLVEYAQFNSIARAIRILEMMQLEREVS